MSLSDYFRSQADWRRQKAEEYPEDRRNVQSAEALEALADYAEHEDAAALVAALEPHLFNSVVFGGEETQRVVSRYGFDYRSTTTFHHRSFLEELMTTCVSDAYEFAREQGGEDPTDTLYPFELDAARQGVFLPPRYFEQRAGRYEFRLEEEVAAYALVVDE